MPAPRSSSAPRRGTGRPPLPLRSPAVLAVAGLVAACVAVAVTFRVSTSDVWQHVLVGKAIWQLGRVPQEHLWTWPLYGTREVLPSWAFAALVWPFWQAGGALGLQLWRWLTTLLAFGLSWATARRLGARGLTPLFVIALCALSYRARGQVRPETLVAVLLSLQVWVLERRRERGGGALALIAIAWVWANVHISYYLGLTLSGIHLLASARRESGSAVAGEHASPVQRLDRMPLAAAIALSLAVSFLNPFGWRALWQPIEYLLVWRREPVYQAIPELAPLLRTWPSTLRSGLPFLVVLWPLLVLGRAARRRLDVAEAMTCALFTAHVLFNQRFSGSLAIVAAPYVGRDLSELAGTVRWPASWWRPPVRAAFVALAVIAASLPAWTDRRYPMGIGFVETCYPAAACDFIERTGLRGRMFNPFYFGGYVVWRFWPQRDRLPFMDIHQSGTRRDRDLYAYCFANVGAWHELMERHHFQMALLDGHQDWVLNDRLLDVLDQDEGWALVFRDDAAALYVRREGDTRALADSLAYHVMPGGAEAFAALGAVVARDTTQRRMLRSELERRLAGSPLDAQAHFHLANLDFMDGDRRGAQRHLRAALEREPNFAGAHRRLGYLAMAEQRWREAIAEFERERALGGAPADEYERMGEAWEKLGDRRRAAAAYRREVDIHAANDAARAALGRVQGD